MQVCDPIYNHPSLNNDKNLLDHSNMSNQPSTPIPEDKLLLSSEQPNPQSTDTTNPNSNFENGGVTLRRSNRPLRACTARAAARLYSAAAPVVERKPKQVKRERKVEEVEEEQEEEESSDQQCNGKIVTPLVTLPVPPALLPRWGLRSMWELASVLNFLNVFRPLLNINAEFSVEELETALLTPNATLSDIHIPLLKAIPPVTRMALGRATWVTVLCRKLRDWWHWVAEGDLPIVASHGTEVDAYNALEPAVRVIILKALCDIRVEQEDIRSYIDSSIKHGVHLSTFRKDRVGGDSHGISYWYEDDPIIGHRLYRQIRTVDVKKVKGKGSQMLPCATYHWETVATNFDEFQDVSEKLFSSKNRTEASLGKKLKNDMLPEIEKVHKKKERLLKKQHREALLLDNYFNMDELGPGRSLRDRKPVTYTFDDFDRSINEAIKITRNKPSSPEPSYRREGAKPEASLNGRLSSHSQVPNAMFSSLSPQSPDYDERDDDEHKSEQLERSNRRRQRPQRYSGKEFVEALSENEADFESDDDIVGEVVYDEEYLKKRKQRHKSSSSEGDEEYNWDAENGEDDEEEEEEEEDYSSNSDDSDQPRRVKKLPGRTRNETKSRSVNALQLGLRRSKRATRNRINYRKYDGSDSETESMKPQKRKIASDRNSDVNDDKNEQSDESSEDNEPMEVEQQAEDPPEPVKQEQNQSPEKSNIPNEDEVEGVQHRRFLDLNELAPGSGFDDGPNTIQDKDTGNF